MKWKNLTIGKKLAVGFTVVLALMTVVGLLSYIGVGGIVGNAGTVIDGNKLDGLLTQKVVSQLVWAGQVNALLTDEKVTTLQVETDDHKCSLGKWLYGKDRKEAEILVPSLVPLLKSIEEPHRKLHHSAIEIDKKFQQPHSDLSLILSQRLKEHIEWSDQLTKSIFEEATGLNRYQSNLKNAVDQAYSIIKAIDEDKNIADKETRQMQAMKMIKNMRYGPEMKDYFWINDTQPKMIMHPYQPQLDGKDLNDYADPNGKRLFVEFVKTCRAKGAGFVDYFWAKYGGTKPVPKISYVKIYRPWGWIVGSGVYLDDTNQALLSRAEDFSEGKPFSLGLQTDPTKCRFGKFLLDPKTAEIASNFPEFKMAMNEVREPHNQLHQSALGIEKSLTATNMEAAKAIFLKQTLPALDKVRKIFDRAMEAESKLQKASSEARAIYADNTSQYLEETQKLLGEIKAEVKRNIMSEDVMLDSAIGTRRNVLIVGTVAIVAGVLLAFLISKAISGPITRMASTISQIGQNRDLTLEVPVERVRPTASWRVPLVIVRKPRWSRPKSRPRLSPRWGARPVKWPVPPRARKMPRKPPKPRSPNWSKPWERWLYPPPTRTRRPTKPPSAWSKWE